MADVITYLDYAATAPLRPEAAAAMAEYMVPASAGMALNANANSLHSAGRAAFKAFEDARKTVAACIGAQRPSEVLFTSGATESDNLAVFGIARAAREMRERASSDPFTPHVIVSEIEHHAVLNPAKALLHEGFEVDVIRPNGSGFIDVSKFEEMLRPETVLVSIQAANSEIGSVQPIEQLARTAHAAGALFHTDATQALGKIRLDVRELDVDAASFSAHKIGGPKGCGALYLKAKTPIVPMCLGGGQEFGVRSGTQDVCSAAGFAAACTAAVASQEEERARLARFRDYIYGNATALDDVYATVEVEPDSFDYLPNIVNLIIRGVESQTAILRFDSLGVEVSGGSACSSSSLDPSHVLTSIGINKSDAQCALRVSFGWDTTEKDIQAVMDALPEVIDWNNR